MKDKFICKVSFAICHLNGTNDFAHHPVFLKAQERDTKHPLSPLFSYRTQQPSIITDENKKHQQF